ncbi:Hypothetical protein R9X50_00425200 [Acrodontium crateriforme]|uniref:Uncharacterized protein n=1 Tax=Acrodontium crateriforme TaxID=150365 RepID=A0AAQ3M402_9PEZI|nr:Hypothetical protein R9X50_00425200 [Acrodontium crateriforme]
MSAPNVNAPNEGIIGQIQNTVTNAANYVSETLQGKSAEASHEANKEIAKGNTNASLLDRATAAKDAVGDKIDQKSHETAAEANKQAI